jgi:hypothetical protein
VAVCIIAAIAIIRDMNKKNKMIKAAPGYGKPMF